MRFIFAVSALIALGMAAPTAEADDTSPVEVDSSLLGMAACLPRTCQSYGCCSGDCGFWCRSCDIKYTC